MKMMFAAVAALVIAYPLAGAAATVSINYTTYGPGQLSAALAARDAFMGGPAVGEEFESFTACTGSNSAACTKGTINTAVGTFSGISPANANGGSQVAPKNKIVVRTSKPDPFGRFNTTPLGANWLDSNDMNGILWTLAAPGKTYFQKIAFFLTDLDDVGNVRFSIQANNEAAVLRPGTATLRDGRLSLITMTFDKGIENLAIRMVNGTGDGFGLDGAQVAAVPLPAAGLMLAGALGGLGALKRRRKA